MSEQTEKAFEILKKIQDSVETLKRKQVLNYNDALYDFKKQFHYAISNKSPELLDLAITVFNEKVKELYNEDVKRVALEEFPELLDEFIKMR